MGRENSKHVQFPQHDNRPSMTLGTPRPSADSMKHAIGSGGRASRNVENIITDEGRLGEQSPLLGPQRSGEGITAEAGEVSPLRSPASSGSWTAEEGGQRETKSSWYLLLLTLAMGGLQIAWSVELSNGSPYLLSLGISKSLLALVWIAGPLSGTLVQPYVGIKSDQSRSRFGKRRPFMVGGALATVASLLLLAWTREIVAGCLGFFGADPTGPTVRRTAIIIAVLLIYVLDFSINVVQAGIRAFIVDNAPVHQQDSANAWAARVAGVGNIVGYLFGYVNLPALIPWLGDTQFKVLCALASGALLLTLAASCTIHERDPRLTGEPKHRNGGVFAFFITLAYAFRTIPPQVRAVCQVQFCAWIGWFPFLFYITTYIGEIYASPFFAADPHMPAEEIDRVWEHATRIGTFALLIFACTSFAASVLLPILIPNSYQSLAKNPAPRTPMTSCTPGTVESAIAAEYFPPQDNSASLKIPRPFRLCWTRFFTRHDQHGACSSPAILDGLTLRRAWLLSHLLFFTLTWLTLFVGHSVPLATTLVALIGIPWAMTNWAPFALIAADIAERRDKTRVPPLHNQEEGDGQMEEIEDQAGVLLGIHNVAIAAPQVISTLVSSVIFRALQRPRGAPDDDSVGWALRFGGVAALVAAWLVRSVREKAEC